MKKIYGSYTEDDNFTTVFSNNTIYTIARATGEWGSVSVGNRTATGHVLDQESYDRMESECEYEGEFNLIL